MHLANKGPGQEPLVTTEAADLAKQSVDTLIKLSFVGKFILLS